MSILKGRRDAGQGGKLGHSNMDHWEFTEEIKMTARKRRRLDAKRQIKEGLADLGIAEDERNQQLTRVEGRPCTSRLPNEHEL